jgi:hypothetical protein
LEASGTVSRIHSAREPCGDRFADAIDSLDVKLVDRQATAVSLIRIVALARIVLIAGACE